MKIFNYILLSFILIIPTAFGDQIPPVSGNLPFKNGEVLKYNLHYGFISGGMAIITLKQEALDNKDVFHATVLAKTTGIVDKIFKVKDIYESYFDLKTSLPYKAVRNVSEGNYKLREEVIYNRSDNTINSDRKGIVKVPQNCFDMISALFYLRRVNFSNYKIGDMVYIDTYFDGLFPLYVIYKGKETISTKMGEMRCLKFVPIVEPGRIFKENDDMLFWLSDDENKLPISVKFDMIVGSFRCDLVEYQNTKYEFKSIIKKK